MTRFVFGTIMLLMLCSCGVKGALKLPKDAHKKESTEQEQTTQQPQPEPENNIKPLPPIYREAPNGSF